MNVHISKECNRDRVPSRSSSWPPSWLPPATDPTNCLSISVAEMSADRRKAFEERAAIMEFDGQLPRAEAERLAMEDTMEVMKRAGET